MDRYSSENLKGGMFRRILEQRVAKVLGNSRPMTVQLDLTNACNLSCAHCYHPHHQNKGGLSLSQWRTIFEQIVEFSKAINFQPYFVLCGGEPLLSPFLSPMLDLIQQSFADANVTVLTNGTLITERHIRLFHGRTMQFQISLDGPDSTRHDAVRGSGSFEASMAGIKKLKDNQHSISILSILSARTRPWIREYFELAKKLGVHSQNFTRLIPMGIGEELVESGSDGCLSPLELKTAYTDIILNSHIYQIPTATDQPLFALLGNTFGHHDLFGINGVIVDYKGQLKVSSRSNFVLGSLITERLEDLFLKHPVMKALQSGEIEGCGTCKYYAKCGGDRNAAFASTGSFLTKDPGCWI